jgi:RNase H-fold protein (predicted Holliday junction resolvase)
LAGIIKKAALDFGADLIGIAPVERMDKLMPQLEKIFVNGKDYFHHAG